MKPGESCVIAAASDVANKQDLMAAPLCPRGRDRCSACSEDDQNAVASDRGKFAWWCMTRCIAAFHGLRME